jgi:hypothetical protein
MPCPVAESAATNISSAFDLTFTEEVIPPDKVRMGSRPTSFVPSQNGQTPIADAVGVIARAERRKT